MWEGPLCPDSPSFFLFNQRRPRIRYQIFSRCARRFPILWLVDQLRLHRVLLDVISDISELPRGSDAGFVVAVLPGTTMANEMRARFGGDMAHQRVHEFWQGPLLTKREQSMPVT